MADPRFYDNRGPVPVEALCAHLEVSVPKGTKAGSVIHDVAALHCAGPKHLAFCDGGKSKKILEHTQAGWCLVPKEKFDAVSPPNTTLLPVARVAAAFAAAARLFYSDEELEITEQTERIHPSAKLGDGVVLAPGVVVGPNTEIGDKTRIGANSVIGRGVTLGRNCEVGPNVWIGFALIGDNVLIFPGARIGAPGFGYASSPRGHAKIPQLGRVVIQDQVEIGANTTIDRGALADTVIGEGTKIDNLVQIGHNCELGRHCLIAGGAGISGSVTLGDFVVVGGAAGIADHIIVGSGARIAAMSGVIGDLPGNRDYGGIAARPIRDWHRESATLSKLAKTHRHKKHE